MDEITPHQTYLQGFDAELERIDAYLARHNHPPPEWPQPVTGEGHVIGRRDARRLACEVIGGEMARKIRDCEHYK